MHMMLLMVLLATNLNLPLTQWRPVREGVTLAPEEGKLHVSYTVAAGKPAGAATRLLPGTLGGVTALKLRITASRNTPLIVTFMNDKQIAYGSPVINARAGTKEYTIDPAALEYSPQQSKGEDPGAYAIGDTVMIAVIDIAGFTGAEAAKTSWTIESIEAVR